MVFYNNAKEFFDGRLMLYQRDLDSQNPNAKSHRPPNWYMRIKIEGRKGRAITKSTKHSIYEDAYRYAVEEYGRITNAVRLGHAIVDWTFEQHWEDWYERQCKNNTWRDSRKKWHLTYYKRYFSEFFTDKRTGKSMMLDAIDFRANDAYWDWRIGYWEREENVSKRRYNPKRRSAKSKSTHNAKKRPALKTLQMEQAALNQIFGDAVARGRTQQNFSFKAPKVDDGDGQRAGFTAEEYRVLTRYLVSYRDNIGVFKRQRLNIVHKIQRHQIYYFVLFLANSGLRVGEARMMKWSDVTFDIEVEGSNDIRIAEVRVSQHTKKNKERYVQVQANGNTHLKNWKKISPHTKPEDWVWFSTGNGEDLEKHQQILDMNKPFQSILKAIPYNDRKDGLLYNADGKRRSLYSLRHIYADLRLSQNVSVFDLAKNMGTQVQQIEKHYSHLMSRDRRAEITKMGKTKAQDTQQNSDGVIREALAMHKAGILSEEALMAILKR